MLDERTIPDAQLPTWMRQARRGIDWGVIIVMVLSIFIAWPLLANEHLPAYTHLENAGFQVSDASSAMLQGWIFPRWSATALQGYGLPVPHYIPPAAPNITAIVNVLFLNDVERAIRLVMTIALLLAGGTLYVFVTQRAGARAGVIAAALYLFSPYVGLVTPYVRGDLPGVLSLAALPTLLWAVNRLLLRDQPLDSLTIALSTAFLMFNDPIWLAIGLLPLLTLLVYDWRNARRKLIVLGISMSLGIALAGVFWLPALLEQNAIRWVTPLIDARNEPITLLGLFARTAALDPDALTHYPQWNLSWGLLVFSFIGLLLMIAHHKETGFQQWFFGLGIISLLLAVWIFPEEHRLLGLAVFCLAIASSASVQLVRYLRNWQEYLLAPLSLLFLIGIAYPIWVQVPDSGRVQVFSQEAQLQYEYAGHGIAVLPPGQAIPTTLTDDGLAAVQPLPLIEGGIFNRFAAAQSSNVQILPSPRSELPQQNPTTPVQGIHFSAYSVVAATADSYRYQRSFFPGWQASLDDEAIALERDEVTGFMTLTLPETRNGDLFIYLDSTHARRLGWLLTFMGFIALVVYSAFRWQRVPGRHEESILLRRPLARMLLLTAIFALFLRIFPNLNPLRGSLAPPPEYGLAAYRQFPNIYEGEVDLTHYCYETNVFQRLNLTLSPGASDTACQPLQSYRPGDTINLNLIWELREMSSTQLMVQLRLISGVTNEILIEEPMRHPGHLPSNRWLIRGYITDRYQFQLPSDLNLGAYTIELELFRCDPFAAGLYPTCEAIEPGLTLPEPIVVE